MTKIVLVGEKLASRSFPGANKALPVLASALRNSGFHDVVQMDKELGATDLDICREAEASDLIAFAGCMSTQWPEIDITTRRLRRHIQKCGNAEVPIIVGGYAAKAAREVLQASPWITAAFNGEGELAISQIAAAVGAQAQLKEMSTIPGLCFVDSSGRYHESIAARVQSFDNIDQSLGLIHVSDTHDMDIFRDGPRTRKTAQIFTQRGCPWLCAYCNKSLEGALVARLSDDSLRDQLRDLRTRGYEAVYLDVDTFTINVKAAKREAALLFEEGFVWGSNTRVDAIDRTQLDFYKRHGCVYLFFGVEHISPHVLIAIDKFTGPLWQRLEKAHSYRTKVKRAFLDMNAVGLPSSYFVILGLPKAQLSPSGNEILEYVHTSLQDDIDAIRFGLDECEPDYINFNVLRFMPGSTAADARSDAFECVRPSGRLPIVAAHFLPRLTRTGGVNEYHGVYRLCEAVLNNVPISTALSPERVYRSIEFAIKLINERIDQGRKPTILFVDEAVSQSGLIRRGPRGHYSLAPLTEFDALTPTTGPSSNDYSDD